MKPKVFKREHCGMIKHAQAIASLTEPINARLIIPRCFVMKILGFHLLSNLTCILLPYVNMLSVSELFTTYNL